MNSTNFSTNILIPTYCPTSSTIRLIKSIMKFEPKITIVIIDDKTPLTKANLKILNNMKDLSKNNKYLKYLRTKKNSHKAGALNYGLRYIYSKKKLPRIIFTLDDDIKINKKTIKEMRKSLYSSEKTGAVCSFVRVSNKESNIITRLQGLEYHAFNLTKIADNTLLSGPLVMQGMLTAFRTSALKDINGFSEGHLIEDYDITTRLKKKGWKVRIEDRAEAWTSVPETIDSLWRQRVRWTYGGLKVVRNSLKHLLTIFQDFVGHIMFLLLLLLILLSFIIQDRNSISQKEYTTLLVVSIISLLISTIYNIILLSSYKDADWKDWLIKLTILPELFYSNLLTINLLGSYLFFLYMSTFSILTTRFSELKPIFKYGLNLFLKIGYSSDWGTKEISKKGGILI